MTGLPKIHSGLCTPLADRRGSIALIVALVLPALLATVALALEVGSWSIVKIELQMRADVAAYAATTAYGNGADAHSASKTGADVAALNGAAAASRSWDAASSTLTSSDVTIQLVSGVRDPSDLAMKVTVTRSIPLTIGRMFSTQDAVTVSAIAWAEVVSVPGRTLQPCLLALNTSGPGIYTETNITISGWSVPAKVPQATARSSNFSRISLAAVTIPTAESQIRFPR